MATQDVSLSSSRPAVDGPVPVPEAADPGQSAEDEPRPQPPGRVSVLDGMRLLAALCVVSYHFLATGGGVSTQIWGQPTQEAFPVVSQIADYGWLGVELFFLISGFVICMSCWGKTLGGFLVSRVARLYPAYWFGVLATTVVLTVMPYVRHAQPGSTVLTNLTMFELPLGSSYVDGVYWTLWAEMRFYLLFALVVWKGLTYRRAVAFCLLWTIASVLAAGTSGILYSVIMPEYAPLFVIGVAAFLMWKFGQNPVLWSIIGFNWLVYQGSLKSRVKGASTTLGHPLSWPVAVVVFTVLLGLLLWLVLGPASRVRWRWLTVAGAMTYPLYLLHEYIGWTAIDRLHGAMPAPVLLAGLLGLLLTVSWLVHRWIERPVGRRLRRTLGRYGQDGHDRPGAFRASSS